MKCHISHIGVIDRSDNVHATAFQPGLNVVTGRSSTGKSALIEIFDYCFGSADHTVPVGVITEHAQRYFVILKFSEKFVVIAREPNEDKAFIRETSDIKIDDEGLELPFDLTDKNYTLRLANFKRELASYFGLTLASADTNFHFLNSDTKKNPRPSVRSFTSFMLQHQNLVANKHAIFYRFDQKEKRDQVAEHIRYFLGFVDQAYFTTSQVLEQKRSDLRALERLVPKKDQERLRNKIRLEKCLHNYEVIAGSKIVEVDAADILNHPQRWLDEITNLNITVDPSSDAHDSAVRAQQAKLSELGRQLRSEQRKLRDLDTSIEYATGYVDRMEALKYPAKGLDKVSECPFCNSDTDVNFQEANKLSDAVSWLNSELRRSPYLKESFEADKALLEKTISEIRREIKAGNETLTSLNEKVDQAKKQRTIFEEALKAKLKIENCLENLVSVISSDVDEDMKKLQGEISKLEGKIAAYKVDRHFKNAEKYIRETMNELAKGLDFEASYKPLDLHFSFETFDLFNKMSGRDVYLRSMGSGANWLYCHLVLFMALHKLFCKYDEQCKIPPIMFFDQPTQVYFPNTTKDKSEAFDAQELATGSEEQDIDADVKAVERFFSEIVSYCEVTNRETGLMPQVIITDHADNLELEGNYIFEDYVRARWRTPDAGFIKLDN